MSGSPNLYLKRLQLEQFRIYERADLTIPTPGVVLVGPNGSGKTSILESVLLLSTTKSRRGVQDADLIRHGSGADLGVAPYARATADIHREASDAKLEIYIERDESKSTTKKSVRVGDAPRRAMDVVGIMPTVAFSPEDLDIIGGSPGYRRRFLDVLLGQVDTRYLRNLSQYGRMLSHRNGLLRDLARGRSIARAEFGYWDEQVTALGAYITTRRYLATVRLQSLAASFFSELAPNTGSLSLTYDSRLDQSDAWWSALVPPDDDVTGIMTASQRVGQVYETQLQRSFDEDRARGATQVGPHRDDISVKLNDRDISRFGSRGQQRIAVVALKLAEISLVDEMSKLKPVLLLDDVLSELDPFHQQTLIETVKASGNQLFLTAIEPGLVAGQGLDDHLFITLDDHGGVLIVD